MDREAFNIIYKNNFKVAYGLAKFLTHSRHEAEDVVQNVFAKLWYKREQIDMRNIQKYIKKMVRYEWYDQYEKIENRERLARLRIKPIVTANIEVDPKLALSAALRSMKIKRRRIFVLYYFHRVSRHALADKFNSDLVFIDNNLMGAKRQLMRML
jgi:RNA polymerase sigma-70 factor (ECF subfamily)